MPITLGTNIASFRAQRQLSVSSQKLGSVFERLSSGQRINRASDDAAGLAIAESLKADTRVFNQGIRNLNDGISVFNIADGAIEQLSSIVTRLQELAEQSANGSFSNQQREALDEEAQALSDEYFRIVQSTEFNGRSLFTADFGELRLQAGYGLDGGIASGLGGSLGTGEFAAANNFSAGSGSGAVRTSDFNGDGILDLVTADYGANTISILQGSGDGSFNLTATLSTDSGPISLAIDDYNGDGTIDIATANIGASTIDIFIGNNDGTFKTSNTFATGSSPFGIASGDFNGDGIADLTTGNLSGDSASVLIGNGDGTFQAATDFAVGNGPSSITVGDFNGDNVLDIVTTDNADDAVSILLGNGDGTFGTANAYSVGGEPRSVTVGDFNEDGILDLVTADGDDDTVSILLGNGDGTLGTATTLATGNAPLSIIADDFNGDGFLDLATADRNGDTISTLAGNGDGTFDSAVSIASGQGPTTIISGDFDGDGVLDLATSNYDDSNVSIFIASTTDGVSPLLEFSLRTQAEARQALPVLERKLDQLASQRGQIGAFQSRVQIGMNNLTVAAENYRAAESRIRDADITSESAALTRLNILQQAASSVLAQANVQPQLALQLLQ